MDQTEEEAALNLRNAVDAFLENLTRNMKVTISSVRSWNCWKEECCSLFNVNRGAVSNRKISHFWLNRRFSFFWLNCFLDICFYDWCFLGTTLPCSSKGWMFKSRANTPSTPQTPMLMHPSHFKFKCIVSNKNDAILSKFKQTGN